jgi:hypothetical protein
VQILGDNINNLFGLNIITSIKGDLFIGEQIPMGNNPLLVNLQGFENLNHIHGDLIVDFNESLRNLSGLDGLIEISGDLKIAHNDSLLNLSGLDNLEWVRGGLSLRLNNNLSSISSLNHSIIKKSLRIEYNVNLTNLTGLENITHIEGQCFIAGNTNLQNLLGLDNLYEIDESLNIISNDTLSNLMELGNLASIGGILRIIDNQALTALSGLDNIDANTISHLNIESNVLLSVCEIQSVCEYLMDSLGTVEISDNYLGCNSREEIEEACIVSVPESTICKGVTVHPNPFKTSTTIKYELKHPATVKIVFYNQIGKQVDVIEKRQQNGLNHIEWVPDNLASGIFYFRLKAGQQVTVGKLVLMR